MSQNTILIRRYKDMKYSEYLKTEYWQNIKQQVLERDKYRCRLCNSNIDLHVHHRTYDYIGEEKLEELITLCGKHHNMIHEDENKEDNILQRIIIEINSKNYMLKTEVRLKLKKYYNIGGCNEFENLYQKFLKDNNLIHIYYCKLKQAKEYGFPLNNGDTYMRKHIIISKELYNKIKRYVHP